MAQIFKLDEKEKELIFELAEKSIENYMQSTTAPIADATYIDESVKKVLKVVHEVGAANEDGQAFVEHLKKQDTRNDI